MGLVLQRHSLLVQQTETIFHCCPAKNYRRLSFILCSSLEDWRHLHRPSSACTCPGEDHPGPRNNIGRGAPEVDIIEAWVSSMFSIGNRMHWLTRLKMPQSSLIHGRSWILRNCRSLLYRPWLKQLLSPASLTQASQSLQVAPFNADYQFVNSSPATTVANSAITYINTYLVRCSLFLFPFTFFPFPFSFSPAPPREVLFQNDRIDMANNIGRCISTSRLCCNTNSACSLSGKWWCVR